MYHRVVPIILYAVIESVEHYTQWITIQIIWENVATSSEAIPSIHPSMDLFMDMGGGA